jgi:branched-chain amino acid transport system permease protein
VPLTLRERSAGHRTYVVVGWLIVAAAAVYVPLAIDVGFTPGSIDQPLRIGQLNETIAFAVAILGLNIVIGDSGQLSLGQSAFVGIGAYTTVILVADHDWSYLATLPVSATLCFLAGLAVGVPATRVKGMYLGVITLTVAYVFPSLVLKYGWLTGGVNGKGPRRTEAKLNPPSWMPFADNGRIAGPLWVYCMCLAIAVILFLLARNFRRSRPGRALLAVRDNEASALAMGVHVSLYKAMAFGASAAYGGLAGSMLMMNRPFASDQLFGARMALFLVVALVAGGAGTIAGAIPGAFVYLFVPYFVSEWTFDQSGMPPILRQAAGPLFDALSPAGVGAVGAVFGLMLLLLIFLSPGGLVAGVRSLRDRVVRIEPNPRCLAAHSRDASGDDTART